MIDLIFTGGTIGSAANNGVISPNEDQKYMLLQMYRELPDALPAEFRTHEPFYILSENMDGKHMNLLFNCIRNIFMQEPDSEGIIVLHGSDTLQYGAAAAGLFFFDSEIPIVYVCANYVLQDPRSNGLSNFACAVNHIINPAQKRNFGVCTAYANTGRAAQLYDALSLLPHLPFDDTLYSMPFDRSEFLSSLRNLNLKLPEEKQSLCDTSPVVYVRPLPGQHYPGFKPNDRAVLLDTYHSGTIGTANPELFAFLTQAAGKGIKVYLCGNNAADQYESTRAYEKLGIQVFRGVSPVTAYMLLWSNYC